MVGSSQMGPPPRPRTPHMVQKTHLTVHNTMDGLSTERHMYDNTAAQYHTQEPGQHSTR